MLIWVINHDIHFRLIKCEIGFLCLINWALKLDLGFNVVNVLIGLCCTKLGLGKIGWIQLDLKPLP